MKKTMTKFYVNNKVRILRKRADPTLPDEIGIVVDVSGGEACPTEAQTPMNSGPAPEMYRVLSLEHCPPGCPKEEDYRGEELEFISWGVSLDIYQFGG